MVLVITLSFQNLVANTNKNALVGGDIENTSYDVSFKELVEQLAFRWLKHCQEWVVAALWQGEFI